MTVAPLLVKKITARFGRLSGYLFLLKMSTTNLMTASISVQNRNSVSHVTNIAITSPLRGRQ